MTRVANQAAMIVWLVVVWVALWGDISAANVASGTLLAVLVLTVFPMKHSRRWGVKFRPVAFARLVGFFGRTIITSNLALSRTVVSRGDRLRTGVIQVPLSWDSDVLLTVLNHMIGMSPGMTVIDVARDPGRLYVHVLQLTDIASARAEVARLELLVLEALAPAEIVAAAHAARGVPA